VLKTTSASAVFIFSYTPKKKKHVLPLLVSVSVSLVLGCLAPSGIEWGQSSQGPTSTVFSLVANLFFFSFFG